MMRLLPESGDGTGKKDVYNRKKPSPGFCSVKGAGKKYHSISENTKSTLLQTPSIPHFSVVCSSGISNEVKMLLTHCEKQGLFTISRTEWLAIHNDITLPTECDKPISPGSDDDHPQVISSPSVIPVKKVVCVVLVEAELCNQQVEQTNTLVPPVRQCKRTLSFLKGICMGYWIVDALRWLRACCDTGFAVDLEEYEVSRCIGAPLSAAPRRARMSPRHMQGPLRSNLFAKYSFLFKNEFVAKKPRTGASIKYTLDLRDISFMAYFCGGTILSLPSDVRRFCLCVACQKENRPSNSNAENAIVLNFKPATYGYVGRKRKSPEEESILDKSNPKCYLCCKESNSSETTTLPEVDLNWLLDSISSYEVKPIGNYLCQ